MKSNLYRLTPGDRILITTALLLSLSAPFFAGPRRNGSPSKVLVCENGTLLKSIDLSEDRTFDIRLSGDKKAVIEIKKNKTRILSSPCPLGICRHAGWIGKPGETIICVPNRLVLKLSGKEETYDAVSF